MKSIKKIILLVSLLFLTSCKLITIDDFVLHSARIVKMDGFTDATVELVIENRSPFTVRIKKGRLVGFVGDVCLGELTMENDVKIKRRSTQTVHLSLKMRFDSPIKALYAIRMITKNPEKVTISGYCEARLWIFRQRMERENVPFSKFIDIFGSFSNYF